MTRRSSYWFAAYTVASLLLVSGCGGKTETPTKASSDPSPGSTPSGPSSNVQSDDPLADLLRLADGDADAAIEQFVKQSPENWFAKTSLQEFTMSETEFAALGRDEKTKVQQQLINRVTQIKTLYRQLLTKAAEANKNGDEETALKYIKAIHRFGAQLSEAGVVDLLKKTGDSLTTASLDE